MSDSELQFLRLGPGGLPRAAPADRPAPHTDLTACVFVSDSRISQLHQPGLVTSCDNYKWSQLCYSTSIVTPRLTVIQSCLEPVFIIPSDVAQTKQKKINKRQVKEKSFTF